MRSASWIFGVSAVLFSTLSTCQNVCTVSPKPPGVACGVQKEPQNANTLIASTMGQTQDDCTISCLNDASCRSFTFEPTAGTCNTYKRTDKQFRTKRTTDGTRFYNKKCFFTTPTDIRIKVSSPGSSYDNMYIYSTTDEPGDIYQIHPARFTDSASSDGTDFSISCDGNLVGELGYMSYRGYDAENPDMYYATIYFPSPEAIGGQTTYVPLSCSIDSASQQLSCTSAAGNLFNACSDGDDTSYGSGLAISSADHPPVATTCEVVSLFVEDLTNQDSS